MTQIFRFLIINSLLFLFIGNSYSQDTEIRENSNTPSKQDAANAKKGELNKVVYTNAEHLTLIGKAIPTSMFYHRVDTAFYNDMPPKVKQLFTNSAGLAIAFTTNSSEISAKWCVNDDKTYANISTNASKGLDLYIKRNNCWQSVGVGVPAGRCSKRVIVDNMDQSIKECILYLPLLDEINSLEIGISASAKIEPLKNPFEKKIVIYGSSILQGISASRAGMTYPARLSRETGFNFINLGLSGNGKMESAVADMLSDIDADAFILDCVPNTIPELIIERTPYMIQTLRKKHPKVPIIVIQSVVREVGNFNQVIGERVKNQNITIENEIKKLQKSGIGNLYFIKENNFLGTDHEGSADGVHPNDLGFDRMLQKLKPQILKILKKNGISNI